MTWEIAALFVLLGGMIVLFLTEKIPVDLTAFAGLTVMVFAGWVGPDEAFTGFSSPAVITMMAVFVLSGGLLQTGVADGVGGRLNEIARGRESVLVLLVMLVAGLLSAFMNNVAATAVMLPAIVAGCRRAGLSPSRLLMPLAFGAILGGTTTLVGTPPNLLTAEVLADGGLEPFGLFAFAPVGLVLLAAGVVFMLTLGRRLLPGEGRAAGPGPGDAAEEDLARVYRLEERVVPIRVPAGSQLDGSTLGRSRLAAALDVQVMAIVRGDDKILAPEPSERLAAGDLLLVAGNPSKIREMLRLQAIEVELGSAASPGALAGPGSSVGAARTRLGPESTLVGRTLADLDFRARYAAVVVQIERPSSGTILAGDLAREPLDVGDVLLVLGDADRVEALAGTPGMELVDSGSAALGAVEGTLLPLSVPVGSPLAGRTLRQSRLAELVGLTVVAIEGHGAGDGGRGAVRIPAPEGDEIIHPGDRLLVVGEPSQVLSLLEVGRLEVEATERTPRLESRDVGAVEAVVAPRSKLAGKSLKEVSFRDRYGLQALSLWREGEPRYSGIARLPLRIGDALLLQGRREKIRLLASDPDFVVLDGERRHLRTGRAPFAVAALGLMVVLVVAGVAPIQVAAFAAAVVVLLSGALTMQEAYRAIEWRAVFLVAAVLPVGIAMERTGAASLLAASVVQVAGGFGPWVTLGALVVLSSLLSQGLDGAPTVVLLGPVVLEVADALAVSPYPLMLGVGLAASAAFMTPFSHKANLLVMGAGGYRSMDYVKVGTPLTVVVLALITGLVPLVFPF